MLQQSFSRTKLLKSFAKPDVKFEIKLLNGQQVIRKMLTYFLYIVLKDFFFLNKNQSLIVHLMHFKVVNSTNINDPLTIFESEQFQNRQTPKNSSRLFVCIFQHWQMCI